VFPPDDLLRSVARSVTRVDTTAPSIDEVDLVIALDGLARGIVEHNRRLFAGESVDWDALVDRLTRVERACRRLRPPGPSGDEHQESAH
jgi:hypothetical protein